MMTGCVYAVMGPMNFIASFFISEVIASISSVTKEDMHMFKNAARKAVEAARPYRLSLLMSLCNSSEKGVRGIGGRLI